MQHACNAHGGWNEEADEQDSKQLLRLAVVQYLRTHRGGVQKVSVSVTHDRQGPGGGGGVASTGSSGAARAWASAAVMPALAFGSGCGPPMGASGYAPAMSKGLTSVTSHGNWPELAGSAVAGLLASGSVLGAWAAGARAAPARACGSGLGLGSGWFGIACNPEENRTGHD